MSSSGQIDASCSYHAFSGGARGLNGWSHRLRGACLRRRRCLIECAAAILAGAALAAGCAAAGSAAGRADAPRAALERELTQLSSPLAELAGLERAARSANAGAAQAAARARPYVELRSLIEVLSHQAHEGVTVKRLQRAGEGFELEVEAVDSAACASWVESLARTPGLASAEMADFKSAAVTAGGRSGREVAAVVRVRWHGATPVSSARRSGRHRDVREHNDREAR